jgi:hypothetical protein
MQTNNNILFKVREKTKTNRARCEILIIDFNSYDANNTIIKRVEFVVVSILAYMWIMYLQAPSFV